MLNYQISDRNALIDSTSNVIRSIENLFNKACINDITKTISEDCVQNLIYFKKSNNTPVENVIRDIIIRSSIMCEYKSSGSSIIGLSTLSYFSKNFKKYESTRNRIKVINDARNEIVELARIIQNSCKRASFDDISQIMKDISFSKSLEDLLIDVLKNATPVSGFNVEKSHIDDSYIQEISGNILHIEIPHLVSCGIEKWNRFNVSSILIDGTIESTSQIHHLLEKASSSQLPFLIICRSASEEVRKTICYNTMRKTIDILLIETGFEIDFHHIFSDLSAIFDCDIVNVNMGDTLSSKLEKRIFKISQIEADMSSIIFKNSLGIDDKKIRDYIRDIQNIKFTLDENSVDEETFTNVKMLVDKRVKFLSSSRYDIKIGKKDIEKDHAVMSKVDRFFRSFPDISKTGVVDISSFSKNYPIINKITSESNRKIFTQRQLLEGFICGFKMYETLIKAEKVLTVER